MQKDRQKNMYEIPIKLLMEPLMPEHRDVELENLAVELIRRASLLEGQIRPKTRSSIAELVRSMNCYYSNLIEGHNTHPRDIDRALRDDYSGEKKKRDLQKEAKAHIEVQRLIDSNSGPKQVLSSDYILWLHSEFCSRLPEDLLIVENPTTGEKKRVIPGTLRDGGVQVGRHIPPSAEDLPECLDRFIEAYTAKHLSSAQKVVAVAASHHRLLWIHPFYDGNGRVTRLFSHAMLRSLEIGSSLWSVSRGLARKVSDYKSLLMAADRGIRYPADGRGPLSLEALRKFCIFFLETCIDQIEYMSSLLEPDELLRRIEFYARDEIDAGRLSKGSSQLLREALLAEEFERGRAAEITGYADRQARSVLTELTAKGLLISDTPRGEVRLGFPIDVVERWFPKLYPSV